MQIQVYSTTYGRTNILHCFIYGFPSHNRISETRKNCSKIKIHPMALRHALNANTLHTHHARHTHTYKHGILLFMQLYYT